MVSYISIHRLTCIACGASFDLREVLLDRYIRECLRSYHERGWGLCPQDQTLYSRGYIALVEIDPALSGVNEPAVGLHELQLERAYRTGVVAHVSRDTAMEHCSDPNRPFTFVLPGVIQRLVDARHDRIYKAK